MLNTWIKDRKSGLLFFSMFAIVCLLNINYALLKSARNALAVADLGGGAGSIPWFELCGTMPGAVLMTLGLSWLLNRYPIERVFLTTLIAFVSFFLVFAIGIYPTLPLCKEAILSWEFLPFHQEIAVFLPRFAAMLFFVMAELWKIALFTVLFWGMVNQFIPLEKAKLYYAPLMLAASIGTILAGPITSLCTSDFLSQKSWNYALALIMGVIAFLSLLTAWLFSLLSRNFNQEEKEAPKSQEKEVLSIWDGVKICLRSPYLLLLAWVTIADYIAYALGEVIFLDVLKQKFPDPRDYCDFMGTLNLWSGILTAVSALVITPYLLKRCKWVVASLVTPVALLVTEGAFFFTLWHPTLSTQIEILVLLGTLFYCFVRAAKYTLFDTSKEISFLLLPPLEKMQGKLVVDGMCARFGRGGGSLLSLVLIQVCGGVLATAPIAGIVAILIAGSCVFATSKLGLLVDGKTKERERLSSEASS